ncbi:ArsR/SmtB family transcription factor [Nonomuraea sp. NPDC052265]|uniref:ArsR/SmtB family transcription factor n=1 Tax=Nonomuraea sp. NPDC052265 TaxID=3364374 RepID=UPI0037CA80E2
MRLEFQVADLAATRFTVSPLSHAIFAAFSVHHPELTEKGSVWRDIARTVPSRTLPLLDILNRGASRVTLHEGLVTSEVAPPIETAALSDELDVLAALDTPPGEREFGGDLWRFSGVPGRPDLDLDPQRFRRALADSVYVFFHRFLAPEWPGMRRRLEARLAAYQETVARIGLGSALSTLSPRLTWDGRGMVIEGGPPVAVDLGGRGLQLQPILGASPRYLGIATTRDRRSSLLTVPMFDGARQAAPSPAFDTLAALVGRARARVIRAIGPGCRTDELAGRLNVSASTASGHVSVLRNAGLITTRRAGQAVHHHLTTLGTRLLEVNG